MVHALHMIRSSLIVPTENVPTWDLCHSTKRINFLSSKQMLFLKVMKGVLNLLNNGTTLLSYTKNLLPNFEGFFMSLKIWST